MKKILFLLLFTPSICLGQPFLRLPYSYILHNYQGDTIKQMFSGDTAKWYTDKGNFSFNKPIFVNGVQLGSGTGSVDTTYTGTWNNKVLTPYRASIVYQPLLNDGIFTKSGNAISLHTTAHASNSLRINNLGAASTYNATSYFNINGAIIAGSTNSSYNKTAVDGYSYSNNGFRGISTSGNGGAGYSTSGNGLLGQSNNYWGVRGVGFSSDAGGVYATGRTGIYATGDMNAAGIFNIPSETDIPVIKGGSGDTTKFYFNYQGKLFANGGAQFGDNTNNSTFESDGTLKFNGNATVFKDLYPSSVTVGSGTSAASFTAYNGANLYAYEFVGSGVLSKALQLGFQVNHDYKEGSDITPHLHLYIPDDVTGGGIKFYMNYTWTNVDQTGTVSETTVSGTITRTASAGINHNAILSFGNISGAGKTISSVFMCRIYRDPADVADTFGTSVWLKSADIHYEIDAIGSRTITSK